MEEWCDPHFEVPQRTSCTWFPKGSPHISGLNQLNHQELQQIVVSQPPPLAQQTCCQHVKSSHSSAKWLPLPMFHPVGFSRIRRLLRHWQAVRSVRRSCSLKIPVKISVLCNEADVCSSISCARETLRT